jgi:hypothetical protein
MRFTRDYVGHQTRSQKMKTLVVVAMLAATILPVKAADLDSASVDCSARNQGNAISPELGTLDRIAAPRSRGVTMRSCINGRPGTLEDAKLANYHPLFIIDDSGVRTLYRPARADGSKILNWNRMQ